MILCVLKCANFKSGNAMGTHWTTHSIFRTYFKFVTIFKTTHVSQEHVTTNPREEEQDEQETTMVNLLTVTFKEMHGFMSYKSYKISVFY
jgi:hypothetical protein